jgi:hypothetical protein
MGGPTGIKFQELPLISGRIETFKTGVKRTSVISHLLVNPLQIPLEQIMHLLFPILSLLNLNQFRSIFQWYPLQILGVKSMSKMMFKIQWSKRS